jgi:hypothetical protein
VVNEQQETLSTPGISSNIQNGTIADDVRMGGGAAVSPRRAENAMDVATGRSPVAFASDTRHSTRLTDALPQWWHLNNNRGEINIGDDTASLKSWWSENLHSPTP